MNTENRFTNQKSDSNEISSQELIRKYREWKKRNIEREMITTKDGMKLPADVAKGIPTLQYIDTQAEIRRTRSDITRIIQLKSEPKTVNGGIRYSPLLGIRDMLDYGNRPPHKQQHSNRIMWANERMEFSEDGNIIEDVRIKTNEKQRGTRTQTIGMQSEVYNEQMVQRRKTAEQEAYLKYLHDEIEKGRLDTERYGTNPSNRPKTVQYSAIATPQFKAVEKYMREKEKKERRSSKLKDTFLKRLIDTFEKSKTKKQTNISSTQEFPAVTKLMKKYGDLPLQKKSFADRHPRFASFWKKFKNKRKEIPQKSVVQEETVSKKRNVFMKELQEIEEKGGHIKADRYTTMNQKRNVSTRGEGFTK